MTDGQTSGPIDRTQGTPGSDKNPICSSDLNKYSKQSSNIFGDVLSSVSVIVSEKNSMNIEYISFRMINGSQNIMTLIVGEMTKIELMIKH